MGEEEEDKFGDDLIKPTSFYSAEHEKTKLNWFCYEAALSFEFEIQHKLGERLKRYGIYEEQIADFSIYLAKQMKDLIRALSKNQVIYHRGDRRVRRVLRRFQSLFMFSGGI
ncbi:MAG: hypothetical protein J7K81_10205 [Methanophagales archaeon]|nr:hypothetical protein [Methanophagales archaeon]